jgi:uncharacterized membrane protein HdeD (DUF308 family)
VYILGENRFLYKGKESMQYNNSILAQLKKNASWYFILGIGLIIGGILALIYSYTATVVSVTYLGILLLITGIFTAIKAWTVSSLPTFFLHLGLGALYSITGLYIIAYPVWSALNITLLLSLFFVIAGITSCVCALTQQIPLRGWVFSNGLIATFLGILIWYQWPYSGLWAIGTFVGIDMLMTGATWVQLALMAKEIR